MLKMLKMLKMLTMLTFNKTSDICSMVPDNKGRFSLLLIVDKKGNPSVHV